jgi:anaerobic magnesium-protoporphyrin IX monomethyl ester cyclase
MKVYDLILISQSEVMNYDGYSNLPIDRLDLFSKLVFPRMIYFKSGFRSHLDLLNFLRDNRFYSESSPKERRDLLNIWNLPGFSGIHIANYLLQFGIHTKVINNYDSEFDQLEATYNYSLNQGKSPLVGISSTFYLSYKEIKRISKDLRKIDFNMEILVGGAFANAETINKDPKGFEQHLRNCQVNYVLHAFNPEEDLKNLILNRSEGKPLEQIKNLAYLETNDFKEGKFHSTYSEWHDPVLNETPALWDNIDLPFLNQTIQMRTVSGCSFSCAFCSYPSTAKGLHTTELELVEKHLQKILNIEKVKTIIFLDDTFNVPVDRFKELLKIFKKYDFEWFSFLRVQYVDEKIAQDMKESGCVGVYLGIESANDTVLKNMDKRVTRSQFLNGAKCLRENGIASMAAFVLGFPGETDETLNDNLTFIESSGVEFFTFKEFYYMENTPVHEKRDQFGLTGIGSKWKHDTMAYEDIHSKIIQMFEKVKTSVFIDADTSLWYIAYLYDQGYSIEQIMQLQQEINIILKDQVNGKFNDDHPSYQRLKSLLKQPLGMETSSSLPSKR